VHVVKSRDRQYPLFHIKRALVKLHNMVRVYSTEVLRVISRSAHQIFGNQKAIDAVSVIFNTTGSPE
jgi:hypothetical protein